MIQFNGMEVLRNVIESERFALSPTGEFEKPREPEVEPEAPQTLPLLELKYDDHGGITMASGELLHAMRLLAEVRPGIEPMENVALLLSLRPVVFAIADRQSVPFIIDQVARNDLTVVVDLLAGVHKCVLRLEPGAVQFVTPALLDVKASALLTEGPGGKLEKLVHEGTVRGAMDALTAAVTAEPTEARP